MPSAQQEPAESLRYFRRDNPGTNIGPSYRIIASLSRLYLDWLIIAQAVYHGGYDSHCKKKLRHCACSPDLDERDIGKLEEKEELTPSDEKKVRHLKKMAKEHDHEFEQRHIESSTSLRQKIQLLWKQNKPFSMNMCIVSRNLSNN